MATVNGSAGQLAGLGSRIVALIIDSVITGLVGGILFAPVVLLVGVGGDTGGAGAGLFLILQLLLPIAILGYFIVMEGMYGYTIGKKLLSIRVVDQNGGEISMGESAIRNVLRIVDSLPTFYIIGIALILLTDDEQRVGDLAASTRVVKE